MHLEAETIRARALQLGAVAAAALLFSGLIIASRWPLIADAPLMHYVVFLMSKGFAPYRDIVDMNLPGSYMSEWLGIKVFGGDAAGWFHWDLLFDLLAVFGSAWIAGSSRRALGIIAGSTACLIHLANGPWDMGQRDWLVAVLLLLSYACLFHFLRGAHVAWVAAGLLLAGLAASIKPPALLFAFVAVGLICFDRRQRLKAVNRIILWALAGLVLPGALVAIFLLKWHDGNSLLAFSRGLIPYYASLQRVTLRSMLWSSLENRDKLFEASALASIAIYLVSRSWRSLEATLLLAGSFCGVLSYIVQGKGFDYHRYPAAAFFSIFFVLEIGKLLRDRGARVYAAFALLAMFLAVTVLSYRREKAMPTPTIATVLNLQSDLQRLGGSDLSGRVQCLDMTWAGCLNALYRAQIVQSTGFLYDFYLFPSSGNSTTAALQDRFYNQITAAPPKVFILSEQVWPGNRRSYAQPDRWPRFKQLLADHYSLIKQYVPAAGDPGGYRLYLLK